MAKILAQVPRGFDRATLVCVSVDAAAVALGAARVDCPECEGLGWWDYGPAGTEQDCVECKGTGCVWIST